jgi:hypothetical protein
MHAICRWKIQASFYGWALFAASMGIVSCFKDPVASPESRAVSVSLQSAGVSFAALGATAPLSASVLDAGGKPISGLAVAWSSEDGAVAEVDAQGLVKAKGNGGTRIFARQGSHSAQVEVLVRQVATQVVKLGGDTQSGQVAKPLASPIEVELRDSLDNPMAADEGKTKVAFAVEQGGSLAQDTVAIDTKGRAKTTWTLGAKPGKNHLTASIGGKSISADFTAEALAGPPAAIVRVGGDGQSGQVGKALAMPVEVELRDSLGNPIADVEGKTKVAFAVKQGGTVSLASIAVDAQGRAATTWTLGTKPEANHLTASIEGQSVAVDFSAQALVGPPASLSKIEGDGQTGFTGESLPASIRARVDDAFGNPVPGITVKFSPGAGSGSTGPASAITDSNGRAGATWTLGRDGGTQSLEVGPEGVNPLTFTATAHFGIVAAVDDENLIEGQTGLVGSAVNLAPTVRLTGKNGRPIAGVGVTFSVAAGGGSVTGAKVKTDTAGMARVGTWTLGNSPGLNTLTARVDTPSVPGNPVSFKATASAAAFHIVIRFRDSLPPTDSRRMAFQDAKAKWEGLIIGDLPEATLRLDPGKGCNDPAFPPITETVDDVLIYVKFSSIDGPGGTLGQAGPCMIRSTGGLPILGSMVFDTDDLDKQMANGQLDEIVTHEMGHVLGFGTLWNWNTQRPPLLADTCPSPVACRTDPAFTGPHAMAAYRELKPLGSDVGKGVPVENCVGESNCGSATLNAHWRESVFGAELMTGFKNPDVANPLSRLSIASLWDEGYTVNYAGADAFVLAPQITALAAARSGKGRLEFGDDLLRIPIQVVDEQGRPVRTLAP